MSEQEDMQRLIANMSALVARQTLAQPFGQQFGGTRDVYAAAGYPQTIQPRDYLAKYLREDVAQRIVDAEPEETWRVPPIIYDNPAANQDADAAAVTPFTSAVMDITDRERVPDSPESETPNLWEALAQADKYAGIGEYGLLVLGINDGRPLDQPLEPPKGKNGRGPKGLLYLTPLHQSQADITTWDTNQSSPRFGKPVTYTCNFGDITGSGDGVLGVSSRVVHWSRVIHIAENAGGTGVYGLPRLQSVYNRLEDLLKIMAGSGESAWRLLYKGLVASTKDGYDLNDSDDTIADRVDEYIHDMKRFLLLEGMDVKIEGGEIVDPSPVVKIIIAIISAATGIPQRILLGSERGELSSTQDESRWKESIQARQVQYAEPRIVRKVINRLIYAGVLPMPENGRYTVEWPSLFEPTEVEQAEINLKRASVIAQLSPAGAPDAYVGEDEVRLLAMFPPRKVDPATAVLDAEDNAPNE